MSKTYKYIFDINLVEIQETYGKVFKVTTVWGNVWEISCGSSNSIEIHLCDTKSVVSCSCGDKNKSFDDHC